MIIYIMVNKSYTVEDSNEKDNNKNYNNIEKTVMQIYIKNLVFY